MFVPVAGDAEIRFRNAVFHPVVTAISVAFVAMRRFLLTILLAAISAGPSFLFTRCGLSSSAQWGSL